MKVVKFGGSSLASSQQFKKVKDIVTRDPQRKIVVVSAIGKRTKEDDKITDLLYILYAHRKHQVDYTSLWENFARRFCEVRDVLNLTYPIEEDLAFLKEELDRGQISEDYLVSRGEYLTARLVADYLNYPFVDAKDVICFGYDGKFLENDIQEKVTTLLQKQEKMVVPGFYGSYPNGDLKIMSRGGSDITGSLLAAAASASVYENWTDVSGILMTDPRIVENPQTIATLSYLELRELSYMGASVLHEAAILPLQKAHIPLNILNTNAPKDAGTLMVESYENTGHAITGIAGKKDFISLLLYKDKMSEEVGFLSKAMKIFEDFHLSIEHVPTGIDHIGIVVAKENVAPHLYELLDSLKTKLNLTKIDVLEDLALIAVVGQEMKQDLGIAGKIFTSLAAENISIPLISQSPQQLSLIMGVKNQDYEKAVAKIYQEVVAK